MSGEIEPKIKVNPENLKARYEMIMTLFHNEFVVGLDEKYRDQIYINKELLHCAVKAYFDDIERYKAYAGSVILEVKEGAYEPTGPEDILG